MLHVFGQSSWVDFLHRDDVSFAVKLDVFPFTATLFTRRLSILQGIYKQAAYINLRFFFGKYPAKRDGQTTMQRVPWLINNFRLAQEL